MLMKFTFLTDLSVIRFAEINDFGHKVTDYDYIVRLKVQMNNFVI